MCFGAAHAKLRILRRASLCRRGLRAAVFLIAFGTPGYGALPAAPTCKPVPFQQTVADFLGYVLSRMEMSGVRDFTRSNIGTTVIRHTAPSGFRLDVEFGSDLSLTAVEGLVRNPTDRDMLVFKEAAAYSFSYFSDLAENSARAMVDASVRALEQKKAPSPAYSGDVYLSVVPTSDGALMFRIRRIECR
jgi:hypothetical protein